MNRKSVKRMVYLILGSLFGLAIASFFNNGNQSFLTWDNMLIVILIVVIGTLIGRIARGLLDRGCTFYYSAILWYNVFSGGRIEKLYKI